MIQGGKYLRIQSELNPWIDFAVILLNEQQFDEAKQIIQVAFDNWFASDSDEAVADYICRALYEVGIEHETYFKDGEL